MTRRLLPLLLALLASWPAYARAQQVVPVSNAPVVRIQMRSGSLTIRTWSKSQVAIESNAPVRARAVDAQTVANSLPPEIPIFVTPLQTPSGPILLPPETFPLEDILNSPHDGVLVFGGDAGADVTVTVPSSSALVWATVGRGSISLSDYHNGNFVTLVRNGALQLRNVSGDGYAEAARGRILAANSDFDRLRARTAVGNIIFEGCSSRQIVASSVQGSIAYDNGTFAPGIARFDSQNGNVAIGIARGGVLIDAHSAQGRIFSGFAGGAALTGTPTDAQTVVGPGGPVVTVNSQTGGIFLYDGSLRARGRLQGAWQPVRRLLGGHPLQKKLPHRGHI